MRVAGLREERDFPSTLSLPDSMGKKLHNAIGIAIAIATPSRYRNLYRSSSLPSPKPNPVRGTNALLNPYRLTPYVIILRSSWLPEAV